MLVTALFGNLCKRTLHDFVGEDKKVVISVIVGNNGSVFFSSMFLNFGEKKSLPVKISSDFPRMT